MLRHQADMGEANFRFAALLADFKTDLGAVPFALVVDKAEGAVQHEPNDFLAGNEFRNLLLGIMDVFVSIRKLIAEFAGRAVNISRPPAANIVDGGEGLFGRLVYRKDQAEILIFHDFLQFRDLRVSGCTGSALRARQNKDDRGTEKESFEAPLHAADQLQPGAQMEDAHEQV